MNKLRMVTVVLVAVAALLALVSTVLAVPPLPSSFYGEVHILDNGPSVGDVLIVRAPGITATTDIVGNTTIINSGGLVYAVDVKGDDNDTAIKDGAVQNDVISFYLGTRLVMTAIWQGGTNVNRPIHPPQALPGGPYVGTAGVAIRLQWLGQ